MATEIILPKFGFTHEESQIARWLKQEGDSVEKGEPIVEVTTDKINMEVEAPESGILAGVRAQEGETMATTEIIAYIVQPGEKAPEGPPPKKSAATQPPEPAKQAPQEDGRDRVTPVASRLAEARGLNLADVQGTGPGGRITRRDVEAAARPSPRGVAATPAARRLARERNVPLDAATGSGPRGRVQAQDVMALQATGAFEEPPSAGELIPLQGMRAAIAERMAYSARTAPHFTLQVDVDATRIEALRMAFNQRSEERISATAILVRACAWALSRHPMVNASLVDQAIQLHPAIDIGVAVAIEKGLIVPVIHRPDLKGVEVIAAELRQLTERAQQGRLLQSDLSGGTFTVSNLGMFGIDRFSAIINPPESAILAVGRINRQAVPIFETGDEIAVRPMMTLTLSVDHRVLDGALAARFLDDLRRGLEEPGWLFF